MFRDQPCSQNLLCAALSYVLCAFVKPCWVCCRPLERRERSLQQSGPTWRAPMLHDILLNLPFLRHAPKSLIEVRLRPWPVPLAFSAPPCAAVCHLAQTVHPAQFFALLLPLLRCVNSVSFFWIFTLVKDARASRCCPCPLSDLPVFNHVLQHAQCMLSGCLDLPQLALTLLVHSFD